MRPLRLELSGLRSYRDRQVIEFGHGNNFFAILGDTGSGKSSILEAITYALYNATTWDERNVRSLLADGMQTMSVALDFSANGEVYRVTRSTSRDNYPPSVHLLERLSNEGKDDELRIDKENAVGSYVQKLLGLDYNAFRSSVVLPQGRFQTLLTARPGERTAILKGILNVDEIEEVRDSAVVYVKRIRTALSERQAERQTLLADPVLIARLAKADKLDAEARLRLVQERQTNFRAMKAAITEANQTLITVNRIHENIQPNQEVSERIAALGRISSMLEQEKATFDEQRLQVQQEEQTLVGILEEHEHRGEGLSQLRAAHPILGRMIEELDGLRRRKEELGRRQEQLAAAHEALAGFENALVVSTKNHVEAEKTQHDAAANSERLSELMRTMQQQVAIVREQQGKSQNAVALLEKRETALHQLADLNVLQTTYSRAQEVVLEAESRLEKLQRDNAAAHASQGVHEGDECPVCRQLVPEGFEALAIIPEDETLAARAAARSAAAVAGEELQRATAAHEYARTARDEALLLANEAAKVLQEAVAHFEQNYSINPIEKSDEDVLLPMRRAVDEATLAEAAARQTLEMRHREMKEAEQQLAEANSALRQEKALLEAEKNAIDEVVNARTITIRELPPFLNLGLGDEKEVLVEAQEKVLEKGRELAQMEAKAKEARIMLTKIEEASATLNKRWREEVDLPMGTVIVTLRQMTQRIDEASSLVEVSSISSLGVNPTREEMQAFSEEMYKKSVEVKQRLEVLTQEKEKELLRNQTQAQKLLEEVELGSEAELDEAVVREMATKMEAARREEAALEQIPLARDLDRRIAPGVEMVAALEELVGLMSDSKFVKYVIARKQKNLLSEASEVFGQMTNGRYGFGDDFLVVERASQQMRDAKTLSGGETFLASLALALGLVEIAGRAGGKLESLFLDEGFGSLDSATLDEALTQLERVSDSGRQVAVVTHLAAVSDRISNVLFVRRKPGSNASEAHWIDGENVTLDGEVAAGLLV